MAEMTFDDVTFISLQTNRIQIVTFASPDSNLTMSRPQPQNQSSCWSVSKILNLRKLPRGFVGCSVNGIHVLFAYRAECCETLLKTTPT